MRVHWLLSDGTCACGRDPQRGGGASIHAMRITCRDCLKILRKALVNL